MIRSFVQDLHERYGACFHRCTVIVPDGLSRPHFQEVFSQGRERGIVPNLLTVQEFALKVRQSVPVKEGPLFLTLLSELRAIFPRDPLATALRQARLLLKTWRFCHLDGGTTTLTPLPLAALSTKESLLWDLLLAKESARSDQEEEERLRAFFTAHALEQFVLFDAFPTLEAPYWTILRRCFEEFSNTSLWTPPDGSSRHSSVLVGEFDHPADEVAWTVQEILRRAQHGDANRLAIVSDDAALVAKIQAEGLCHDLSFRTASTRSPLKETRLGSFAKSLAAWLAAPSLRNLTALLGHLVQASTTVQPKRSWSLFWERMAHAPGRPFGGQFLLPQFATPLELKPFLQQAGREDPAFLSTLDLLFLDRWLFPERAPFSEFLDRFQQAWVGLQEIFDLQTPPFWLDAPLPFDEVLTSEDSLLVFDALFDFERLPVAASATKGPWLLPTASAPFYDVDVIFCVGMSEAWAQRPSIPPFFQAWHPYRKGVTEEAFQAILRHPVVLATRSKQGQPHALWHQLKALPRERILVPPSASPSRPASSASAAGSLSAREPNSPASAAENQAGVAGDPAGKAGAPGSTKEGSRSSAIPAVARASVAPMKRPRIFSVTDWQLLQDDPYAFYARTLLKLRPIVHAESLARDFGIWAHDFLQRYFSKAYQTQTLEEFAQTEQGSLWLAKMFIPRLPLHQLDDAWALDKDSVVGIQTETKRSTTFEVSGKLFTLYGICDRVDQRLQGIRVVDYKTGKLPKEKEIRTCESWQLPVEALCLQRLNPSQNIEVSIISLKPHWAQSFALTLPFDEAFQETVVETLTARLEAYAAEDFVFETSEQAPRRAFWYAALARFPQAAS